MYRWKCVILKEFSLHLSDDAYKAYYNAKYRKLMKIANLISYGFEEVKKKVLQKMCVARLHHAAV